MGRRTEVGVTCDYKVKTCYRLIWLEEIIIIIGVLDLGSRIEMSGWGLKWCGNDYWCINFHNAES